MECGIAWSQSATHRRESREREYEQGRSQTGEMHVVQDVRRRRYAFGSAAHNTSYIRGHYPAIVMHNNAVANLKERSSSADDQQQFGGPEGLLHNCNSISDVSNSQDPGSSVVEACVSEKKLSSALKQSTDNFKLDIESQCSFDASASTQLMREKPGDTHEGFNVYRVKLLIEQTAEKFHVTDSIAAAFESMCRMPRKMIICVTEVIEKTYPSLYVLFRRGESITIGFTTFDYSILQPRRGIGDYVHEVVLLRAAEPQYSSCLVRISLVTQLQF